jgi:hypothetical protein
MKSRFDNRSSDLFNRVSEQISILNSKRFTTRNLTPEKAKEIDQKIAALKEALKSLKNQYYMLRKDNFDEADSLILELGQYPAGSIKKIDPKKEALLSRI